MYILIWLLAGTFFVAAVYFVDAADSWGLEGRHVWGFFYTYMLALIGGFPIQIVAAVAVRYLTRSMRLHGSLYWSGLGAAAGAVVPWAFARAGYLLEGVHFAHEWQTVKAALMFPLSGAMMYEVHPVWVRLAVGAATGGTVWFALHSRRRDDG
jgi:hypothetical protein